MKVNIQQSERDRIIEEHTHMIRYITGRFAIRLPRHIDIEDLESAGAIGLIDAVDKFDASKGIKLKTYAEIRIRGAILDELRSRDYLPRSVREKCTHLKVAYAEMENKLGRSATDEEIADYLNINMDDFYRLLREINTGASISLSDLGFDDESSRSEEIFVDHSTPDFTEILYDKEKKERLAKAIGLLPEKERLVISLYYYDELTLKEIGEVVGLTESRVCQIHSKAMFRLKGRIRSIDSHADLAM